MELRVQDVGEQGLLKRVQAFCPSTIVGDDAAVLPTKPGRLLVVTTDVLVDGVHFSDRTTPPESVGWRAAAANLSDLAAMGASPLGITIGLGLPGELAVAWVDRLYRGITDCLNHYGTTIVGGDICRSPVITVSITAFGQVDPNGVIRRSTAQPGDAILVTGYHGLSRAGLELLLNPAGEGLPHSSKLSEADRAALIRAHQYPNPRLDVHPPFPCSGMDSSDGLADAVLQICRSSGVGATLDRDQILIHPALRKWVSAEQAMQWALYGGEDFELVLCLPQDLAQELVDRLGEGSAIVGTITSNPKVQVVDSTGKHSDQILALEEGFQHFKSE